METAERPGDASPMGNRAVVAALLLAQIGCGRSEGSRDVVIVRSAPIYSCTTADSLGGAMCFQSENACLAFRDHFQVTLGGFSPCETRQFAQVACMGYDGASWCFDNQQVCNRLRDSLLPSTSDAPEAPTGCRTVSQFPRRPFDIHCVFDTRISKSFCFRSKLACAEYQHKIEATGGFAGSCRRSPAFCTFDDGVWPPHYACMKAMKDCDEARGVHMADRGGDWSVCRLEGQ